MPDFTKGKWVDSTCGTIRIEDDNGESKCSICQCFVDEPYIDELQSQANARLIAAAPDMFKLLEDFCKIYSTKAQAKSNGNPPAFMSSLIAEEGLFNMAKEILARIKGKETGHE